MSLSVYHGVPSIQQTLGIKLEMGQGWGQQFSK